MNDIFAGYACVFNQVDLGNDVILPQAFARCLAEKPKQNISMLWQHDPNQPIGIWQDIFVDEKGLYVVGRLSTQARQARDVAIMIADKVIDGLSIGFKTRDAQQKARQSTRYIHDLDLWEISIVTFPMQLGARIESRQSPLEQRITAATTAMRA